MYPIIVVNIHLDLNTSLHRVHTQWLPAIIRRSTCSFDKTNIHRVANTDVIFIAWLFVECIDSTYREMTCSVCEAPSSTMHGDDIAHFTIINIHLLCIRLFTTEVDKA